MSDLTMPEVKPNTDGHYSIRFRGDAVRVSKVLIDGEDVTKLCEECIAGDPGWVRIYTDSNSLSPKIARRGKVEVVLREGSNERPS